MCFVCWGKSKCEATEALACVMALLLFCFCRSVDLSFHFLHCRLMLHCRHSMTDNSLISAH